MKDERQHHDEFYGDEASHVFGSAVFLRSRERYLDFLKTSLKRPEPPSLLSLGVGDGAYELSVAPLVRRLVGIELSPVASEIGRRRATSAGFSHLEFRDGDARSLRTIAAGETFDVIWAVALLHHLASDEQSAILADVAACLNPGGVFMSVDPSRRRLVGYLKSLVPEKISRYHSPDEEEIDFTKLAQQVTSAGLTVEAIFPVDYFLNPLAWVLPRTPAVVVPALSALDTALCFSPGIRRFASSFGVVARKSLS